MGITPKQFVLQRLRPVINKGKPIVGAGCSSGLIAKSAELAGADLIIVYSTGWSRLMGLPTIMFGDSNKVTLQMGKEIRLAVKDAPLIAGIVANDPLRTITEVLEEAIDVGFKGVINFPTVGIDRLTMPEDETLELGFEKESKLIEDANQMGLFTMAYVFTPHEAKAMAAKGVDVVVAHMGWTTGGLVGADADKVKKYEEATASTQEICQAAEKEKPDVILLAHGGSFTSAEDTKVLYEYTDAVGFVGASTIERIPVEKEVMETVRAFKNASLPERD